jgi:hypothetical protein
MTRAKAKAQANKSACASADQPSIDVNYMQSYHRENAPTLH